MKYLQYLTILFAKGDLILPTYDRLRNNRGVLIEFIPIETFNDYPYMDRFTLTTITQGEMEFIINDITYKESAPFCICSSFHDTFKVIKTEEHFQCKSFSFHPTFVNSSLQYDALKNDDFCELEDQHDRDIMQHFLHTYGLTGVYKLTASTYLRINEWMNNICAETFSQSDWYWTCRIRRYFLQSMYLIDDLYMEQQREDMMEKAPITRALDYIHSNYNSCIRLEDICNITNTNRTSLNKIFKDATGTTVIDYLSNYRITLAKHSLSHTDLDLFELADALGYKYDTYFIKQFQKKLA
jgi:AraC-like DNA-binding protein